MWTKTWKIQLFPCSKNKKKTPLSSIWYIFGNCSNGWTPSSSQILEHTNDGAGWVTEGHYHIGEDNCLRMHHGRTPNSRILFWEMFLEAITKAELQMMHFCVHIQGSRNWKIVDIERYEKTGVGDRKYALLPWCLARVYPCCTWNAPDRRSLW